MSKAYVFGDRSPMCMANVTVEDPDEHRTKAPVDSRGRVSVGVEYAGKTVNIVMEVVEDND